jgi:hypothetical protein
MAHPEDHFRFMEVLETTSKFCFIGYIIGSCEKFTHQNLLLTDRIQGTTEPPLTALIITYK